MITVTSASAPVFDTMNPDPGTVWAVMWVRAEEDSRAGLVAAHDAMVVIPEVLAMLPKMTWLLFDVVVEEVVEDHSSFRIRFAEAKRYK